MTDRPFVIGVTGNIACGKSTVMRLLGDRGVELIDADTVYHDLIAPGRALHQTLVNHFGNRILDAGGAIDRRALGTIVFVDPAALAVLDRLTHPAVIEEIRRRIDVSRAAVIAVDAVKLIESGLDAICDQVWLVTCDPERQIARLIARNGLTRAEAERRIAAQPPLNEKLKRADLVIDNSGTVDDLRAQIDNAWTKLSI